MFTISSSSLFIHLGLHCTDFLARMRGVVLQSTGSTKLKKIFLETILNILDIINQGENKITPSSGNYQ